MDQDTQKCSDKGWCRSSRLGAAGIAFALPSNFWLFVPGITLVLGRSGLFALTGLHMLGIACCLAAMIRREGLLGFAGFMFCLLPLAKILNWV